MTVLDRATRGGAAQAGAEGLYAHTAGNTTRSEHAARNRRLGWILFGIFAAIAAFSIVFIYLRSVGR